MDFGPDGGLTTTYGRTGSGSECEDIGIGEFLLVKYGAGSACGHWAYYDEDTIFFGQSNVLLSMTLSVTHFYWSFALCMSDTTKFTDRCLGDPGQITTCGYRALTGDDDCMVLGESFTLTLDGCSHGPGFFPVCSGDLPEEITATVQGT